jgi:hypothetical protein
MSLAIEKRRYSRFGIRAVQARRVRYRRPERLRG